MPITKIKHELICFRQYQLQLRALVPPGYFCLLYNTYYTSFLEIFSVGYMLGNAVLKLAYLNVDLDLEVLHLLGGSLGALGLLALVGGGLLGEFLGVRKEFGLAGNVLAQNLGNLDTLHRS